VPGTSRVKKEKKKEKGHSESSGRVGGKRKKRRLPLKKKQAQADPGRMTRRGGGKGRKCLMQEDHDQMALKEKISHNFKGQ